jgi:hypothetical protein
VRNRRFRPTIARTFPLSVIGEVVDFLARGGHFGKVVLEVAF